MNEISISENKGYCPQVMDSTILVLNIGSSSIKFAVYKYGETLGPLWRGNLEPIGAETVELSALKYDGNQVNETLPPVNHEDGLRYLVDWLGKVIEKIPILAAGHRVVHGGTDFHAPVLITTEILHQLKALSPLAPLHQPHNLKGVEILTKLIPDLPQVACFDTAFHRTMPELAQMIALPQAMTQAGIQRYGFHGLSYEYIAEVLPDYLGYIANENVIIAHLGNGASLCALQGRKSIATTMGFSPLDGIPMATRCGAIDPGVLLYLQETMGMTVEQVSHLLNYSSGLAGLSGMNGDMRTLLASSEEQAKRAVDYFVYHVIRAIGSLTAALGGLDALVFTAGIGEHAILIRERVCLGCKWLDLHLDKDANNQSRSLITTRESKVSAWVIPTNEELMIAQHTMRMISNIAER